MVSLAAACDDAAKARMKAVAPVSAALWNKRGVL